MAKGPGDDEDSHDAGLPGPAPGQTPQPSATPTSLSQALQDGPWRAYLDFTRTVAPGGPREPPPRSFSEGQVLAGRFRIVGFLGAGGMGEVYEAEDAVLRERVALKTLRADSNEARSAQDFMREIHLARKVTHANVCRIFDVFHHREPGAPHDVAFLSMELIRGETLSRKLARDGRLTPGQSLPLLRQMAAALDAAHARGVVHRDFKSGNAMLVPDPDASETPRVVVTDFGLAQGQAGDDSFSSGSSGRIVGTPAYMAPEQVTGGRAGPAADVYALGVVTYEMLTGRPPFMGDTPLATAALRLEQAPAPPTRYVRDLDPAWERAILRCLARDPAARFQRAGDFVRALESPGRLERWRSPGARFAAALGLGLTIAAAGYLFDRFQKLIPQPSPPAGDPAPAPRAVRRSVAVLGFRNLTAQAERAWVSTALSEMLSSELALGGQLRLIPGESVARARLELGLADSDALAPDTLGSLRRNLSADRVVLGSYFAAGERAAGKLRLDLRVLDTTTGEALHTLIENGTESELPALVARCGQNLRAALAAGEPAAGELGAARASFAQNPQAARAYAEGLMLLRRHDAAGARRLLLDAVAAEPRHALAHAALAEAWELLGYQGQAKGAAQRSLELSADLSREERMSVEARSKKHGFDWAGAAASYQMLWDFFPDNLEYGLELAQAKTKAGQPQEALTLVATLRRLQPPLNDDPRIDLAEARAASALSDFKRADAAAGEAARKGLAAGARLIAAEALLQQAWAAFQLGDAPRVAAQAAEARRLFEEAGDRNGAADAMQLAAHVLWMQQGEFQRAQLLYQQALQAYRASGNQRGVVQALVNGAGPRAEQGDFEGARRLCEEALPVLREIGDKPGEQSTLVNLARLLIELGDLDKAEAHQRQALQLARDTGARSEQATALEGLGTTLMLRGELDKARERHAEALDLRTALSQKVNASTSRADLARVLAEQRQYEQAATAARSVAEEMRAAGQGDLEASALVVLTRALLGAGRLEEARLSSRRAEELAPSLGRVARLGVEVIAGHVQALTGPRAEGLARLRAVLAQARRSRQVALELEAWRALVVLGEERGDELARQARARGFGLYAQSR